MQLQVINCAGTILRQVCEAIRHNSFNLEACEAAACGYGAIREGQEFRASDIVREFKVLRQCIWQLIAETGIEFSPETLINAQARADMVLDEVMATAVEKFVENLFINMGEAVPPDPMMRIYSRALFQKEIEIEIKRCDRFSHWFTLIIMHFNLQEIEEEFGTQAIERVMVDLTNLLRLKLRQIDKVFRYDTAEFALVCPETDEEGVRTLLQRIEFDIAEYRDHCGLNIQLRCGISSYPQDGRDATSLIQIAIADLEFHNVGREC